ncbi:hypothetical protein IH981_00175, partial [Patescibacteria group bacterium]|nr:hypothetical protein [Patescibacteria group bacterium]
MKKKILIAVAVIFFIVAGIAAYFLFGPGRGQIEKFMRTKQYNVPADAASCGDKKEFFSVSPVKTEDFTNLDPLGAVSPPAHTFPTDHMYFFIKNESINDPESVPNIVPVVAPGDMTITNIGSQERY